MSERYPGGFITKTPTAPTSTSAPGVWTLEQAMQYIKAGTWPTPPQPDQYFNYTTLLLPGSGTNGSNNNAFLDSSGNGLNPTRNGNTTQGTFSPFSQTGWSNYFDGTGDWLTVTNTGNYATAFGTGNFTIEFWIYPTAAFGTYVNIYDSRGTDDNAVMIRINSGNITYYSFGADNITATQPAINTWSHIALSRVSGSSRLYINGTQVGSTYSDTRNYGNESVIAIGGRNNDGANAYTGYISNLRVVNGGGLYTGSTITVPTTPLTTTVAAGTTRLLTCNANRFVDGSSSALAITVNGNTSVQAFSPFAPTAAYSAATNGGSGYFDGTGDYLSVASNAAFGYGTGDFEISFWIYKTSSADAFLIDQRTSDNQAAVCLYISSNTLFLYVSGDNRITSSVSIIPNTWYYVTLSRVSGTTKLFLNGSQTGSNYTDSTNYITSPVVLGIRGVDLSSTPFIGYMSSVRIVKGSGVTSQTVPTTPLTAITNTQLLCNFTNAGITDATAKNDLETVGNAQISNTTAKFGSTSMYFDGTGDYLSTPNNPAFNCGTGDFTIEAWVYPTASGFVVVGQFGTLTTGVGSWILYINTSNYVEFYYDGQSYSSDLTASTVPLNSWSHLAIARYGSTVTGYLNGSLLGSFTYAGRFGGYAWPLEVGATTRSGGNIFSTGYIQDLRITKGIARYTQPFTPPTAAFQLL